MEMTARALDKSRLEALTSAVCQIYEEVRLSMQLL